MAKGDPEEVIVTKRKCRDVLFLIIFIAFIGGMLGVSYIAFTTGNTDRVQYSFDSYGNLCGVDNTGRGGPDFTSKPKLYYPNPLDLVSLSGVAYAEKLCIDSCPNTELCNPIDGLSDMCSNDQFYCTYYKYTDLGDEAIDTQDAYDTQYFDKIANIVASKSDACPELASGMGTLLDDLPDAVKSIIEGSVSEAGAASDFNACGNYIQTMSHIPGEGPCYPVLMSSIDKFNRCFPVLDKKTIALMTSAMDVGTDSEIENNGASDGGDAFARYINDLQKGLVIIVGAGFGGAFILSFIWLFILRKFAGIFAWFTVIGANVLFLIAALFCWLKSGTITVNGLASTAGIDNSDFVGDMPDDWQDPTAEDKQTWTYAAYVATAFAVVLLIATLVMIKRIKIAVATIEVASEAISAMPQILFFPVIPFLLLGGFIVFWCITSALLYSAGEVVEVRASPEEQASVNSYLDSMVNGADATTVVVDTDTAPAELECADDKWCYYTTEWDQTQQYLMIYHFFGFLWITQFLIGFTYVVIAGSIANFYWNRGNKQNMPKKPVTQAMKNALSYHLGSIALGSFIVAIVQFIRAIIEYMDKTSKGAQGKNKIAKYAIKCLKCFAKYLEKVIKFINRNAYILVAIKGDNYCKSAIKAVQLIINNALRLAAVNTVGDFLIFLGKLACASGAAVIAFALTDLPYFSDADLYPNSAISSPLLPVIISLVVGFAVTSLFFNVYEMAVDTVILSFCVDCDMHDEKPKYAPEKLLKAISMSAASKQKKSSGSKGDDELAAVEV